jgi:hypothetical protein
MPSPLLLTVRVINRGLARGSQEEEASPTQRLRRRKSRGVWHERGGAVDTGQAKLGHDHDAVIATTTG